MRTSHTLLGVTVSLLSLMSLSKPARADDPKPSPEIQKLSFLVGKFATKETDIVKDGTRKLLPNGEADGEQENSWWIDGHKIKQSARSQGKPVGEMIYAWDPGKGAYHTFGFGNGRGMPVETIGRLQGNSLMLSPIPNGLCGIGVQSDPVSGGKGPFVVRFVTPSLPADKAGIGAGDVIAAIDGKSTEGLSGDELSARLAEKRGAPIHISFRRDGKERTVSMKRAPLTTDHIRHTLLPKTGGGYIWITETRDSGGNWYKSWELDCTPVK